MSSESGARNVVLVHGGFVDGSAGRECTTRSPRTA